MHSRVPTINYPAIVGIDSLAMRIAVYLANRNSALKTSANWNSFRSEIEEENEISNVIFTTENI